MEADLKPFSPCEDVERLRFQLTTPRPNRLKLSVRLSGPLQAALDQASRLGQRRALLWKENCFELFLRLPCQTNYWEINLAPGGDWNCFSFTNYRENLKESQDIQIHQFLSQNQKDYFCLETILDLKRQTSRLSEMAWVGFAAVLENQNGLNYFAVTHETKPDFHNFSQQLKYAHP